MLVTCSLAILLIISACSIFFEDQGQIIGNPDFVPSYQHVTLDTFIDAYMTNLGSLELPTNYITMETDSSWDARYLINDKHILSYDEGFMILEFTPSSITPEVTELMLYVKALVLTLDPQTTSEAFDASIAEYAVLENFGDDVTWSDLFYYGDTVRYEFNTTDQGIYELHAEDTRMGH